MPNSTIKRITERLHAEAHNYNCVDKKDGREGKKSKCSSADVDKGVVHKERHGDQPFFRPLTNYPSFPPCHVLYRSSLSDNVAVTF